MINKLIRKLIQVDINKRIEWEKYFEDDFFKVNQKDIKNNTDKFNNESQKNNNNANNNKNNNNNKNYKIILIIIKMKILIIIIITVFIIKK